MPERKYFFSGIPSLCCKRTWQMTWFQDCPKSEVKWDLLKIHVRCTALNVSTLKNSTKLDGWRRGWTGGLMWPHYPPIGQSLSTWNKFVSLAWAVTDRGEHSGGSFFWFIIKSNFCLLLTMMLHESRSFIMILISWLLKQYNDNKEQDRIVWAVKSVVLCRENMWSENEKSNFFLPIPTPQSC